MIYKIFMSRKDDVVHEYIKDTGAIILGMDAAAPEPNRMENAAYLKYRKNIESFQQYRKDLLEILSEAEISDRVLDVLFRWLVVCDIPPADSSIAEATEFVRLNDATDDVDHLEKQWGYFKYTSSIDHCIDVAITMKMPGIDLVRFCIVEEYMRGNSLNASKEKIALRMCRHMLEHKIKTESVEHT